VLGYLHGIKRGTFEQLITYYPEGEAIVHSAVFAQAAYGAVVLASYVQRQGIELASGVIHHI
jgi:hypothetical protein